jgi:signal transduction histidine kinase
MNRRVLQKAVGRRARSNNGNIERTEACEATLVALDALPAQIAVLDKSGQVVAVNHAWREFPQASDSVTDRFAPGENYLTCSAALPAVGPHFAEFTDGVREVLSGNRPEFSLEYPHRVKGEERWFQSRVTRSRNATNQQVVIAHEDITERVRLERAMVGISERQQQRFRQELHDGLSQQLTGLKFKASLLEYHLQSKNLPEASEAKALSELLNQATDEASKLARQMRPVEVESRGLMMALRELATNVVEDHEVSCIVEIQRPVFIHDNNTATNLFRIAEQAVSNAVREGRAQRIRIALAEAGQRVTLSVRDDGRPLKDRSVDGFPTHTMRYHARMIGGTLEWRKEAKKGTMLLCSFHKHATSEV